jgi:signal peptidase I
MLRRSFLEIFRRLGSLGRAIVFWGGIACTVILIGPVLLYQPYEIPASSMLPTLLVGDIVVVSKFSYGYGRFSLPFKLSHYPGRLFGHEPGYGDVVAFAVASDTATTFMKRVVGLPGDEIQMRGGTLFINGREVPKQRVENFIVTDIEDVLKEFPTYRETLPNGVSYLVVKTEREGVLDNTELYKVPANHYFMLGDNRDNSVDSREKRVGFVAFENLIGRAEAICFSAGDEADLIVFSLPSEIRWRRLFMAVR